MSFLKKIDYQSVVDMLDKLNNQFNKPNLRFLKGDLIALALQKATQGRLEYVDAEGYDSVDKLTGEKYEFKSTFKMFKDDRIVGRVSLANTNKDTFHKTFDYMLCIQSDPKNFAIAQLSWDECYNNHIKKNGQFDLAKGVKVSQWICKDSTRYKNLPTFKLDIRQLLESII